MASGIQKERGYYLNLLELIFKHLTSHVNLISVKLEKTESIQLLSVFCNLERL